MNPLLKGPRSLCVMCILCICHTQQIQSHGTGGIRAPCNPNNLSVILGGNHFPLHFFPCSTLSVREKRSLSYFVRKEPSAFPITAGKASAHVLKTPIFNLEQQLRARSHNFSSTKRMLQRMGGFAVSSGLPQKSSTCEHPKVNLDEVVQATPCAVPLAQGQGDAGCSKELLAPLNCIALFSTCKTGIKTTHTS